MKNVLFRGKSLRLGILSILMCALALAQGNPPVARAEVSGFHVSGRFLLDANGNNFIMRGINVPHNWYLEQTSQFQNTKAKGANTVRVVLSSGQLWPKNTASDVANVINLCKTNKLICVLEVHDTTGYGEAAGAATLAQAVTYWKEIKSVLIGQEAYVIINIGNEPYGNLNTSAWINATKNAIAEMRTAGFQHMLMVDAPDWGQDWEFIMRDNAASVFNSDPNQNTVFSIHMYGVFNTANKINSYLTTFVNAGLPLVIGEFGHEHSDGNPDEDSIMSLAQSKGIGYLGWMWSGGGYLDMVTAFDPNQETWWGNRIIHGQNGIAATSQEASVYSVTNASVQVTIAGVSQGTYNIAPGFSVRPSYAGVDDGPVKVESTNGIPIVAALRDAWIQNGVVQSWAQLMGLPDTQLATTYYFPAYNNVTLSDQLRLANLGAVPTTVTVKIGSVINQSYVLQAGESLRVSYPGADSGPVTVSSDGQLIIAALREAWSQNNVVESWSQLMGLPDTQLSTSYYFPAYYNVTLSDQLRFANLGNTQTTITVKIGSVVNESYVLQAAESLRVSYPGVDSGPVTVSSDGEYIIAALRNAWSQNGIVESWVQLMGLPDTELSDTYYFPAYNNVTLSDQLRFANLGNAQTTVTVKIGTVVNQSYVLQAGESLRVSYPGVDSGPVTVSSDGQLIIAALREAWSQNGIVESWAQLMGLPASQLSDTYYFPAYNNVTYDNQLRIGVP